MNILSGTKRIIINVYNPKTTQSKINFKLTTTTNVSGMLHLYSAFVLIKDLRLQWNFNFTTAADYALNNHKN